MRMSRSFTDMHANLGFILSVVRGLYTSMSGVLPVQGRGLFYMERRAGSTDADFVFSKESQFEVIGGTDN